MRTQTNSSTSLPRGAKTRGVDRNRNELKKRKSFTLPFFNRKNSSSHKSSDITIKNLQPVDLKEKNPETEPEASVETNASLSMEVFKILNISSKENVHDVSQENENFDERQGYSDQAFQTNFPLTPNSHGTPGTEESEVRRHGTDAMRETHRTVFDETQRDSGYVDEAQPSEKNKDYENENVGELKIAKRNPSYEMLNVTVSDNKDKRWWEPHNIYSNNDDVDL